MGLFIGCPDIFSFNLGDLFKNIQVIDIKALKLFLFRKRARIKLSMRVKKTTSES